jgi:Uma2 family endonuclease
MAYPVLKYVSPEEYLAMEVNSVDKHEYFNGEIVAMAGNTQNHNRIVNNLIGELHGFLKGKECESYPSDLRVATPLFTSYMYPDVTIVCGETEMMDNRFDTLTNPTVVFEVMSKTTEQNDRGYKYFYYQKIPSLKEYILIDSNSYHAEIIKLEDDRSWRMTEVDGINETLFINAINMHLPLKDIYDRVSF